METEPHRQAGCKEASGTPSARNTNGGGRARARFLPAPAPVLLIESLTEMKRRAPVSIASGRRLINNLGKTLVVMLSALLISLF